MTVPHVVSRTWPNGYRRREAEHGDRAFRPFLHRRHAAVMVCAPASAPSSRTGSSATRSVRNTGRPSTARTVTTMPPKQRPMPACASAEKKIGPACSPNMPTNAAKPSAIIRLTAPSGMRPNSGYRVRRWPTARPASSVPTLALSEIFMLANRETDQDPDQAAKEDRQPQRHEVRARRGHHHRTDAGRGSRHHRLRPDHLQRSPPFQRDAGSERNLLASARDRAQSRGRVHCRMGKIG